MSHQLNFNSVDSSYLLELRQFKRTRSDSHQTDFWNIYF